MRWFVGTESGLVSYSALYKILPILYSILNHLLGRVIVLGVGRRRHFAPAMDMLPGPARLVENGAESELEVAGEVVLGCRGLDF